MRAVLLGFAALCGLCACGKDAAVSPSDAASVRDIGLKLASPASLVQASQVDSVTLAWTHDTLSGIQVAVVNDSLAVPRQAMRSTSLSLRVALAEGSNRFVLRLSDGSGIWSDTAVIVRGALPPAPAAVLLSPRRDTAHAWDDSVISVRWRLSGAPLESASFAGQVRRSAQDSLVFRVVLRPGLDTLVLAGRDAYGRTVQDTVHVRRGFYAGLADPLANLVVGGWQGDTAMPVPQAMRDSLALSPSYAMYKIGLDSTLDIRYGLVLNPDQTFASRARLHFQATSALTDPALALDEWIDSIYVDRGTWKVVGDSLELTRQACSKARSPYIRLVNTAALIDQDTSTHGLAASSDRDGVCAPETSRIRIAFLGAAWPMTISGLLPGQEVAMRFVRAR